LLFLTPLDRTLAVLGVSLLGITAICRRRPRASQGMTT
jgi:hypothetical protein